MFYMYNYSIIVRSGKLLTLLIYCERYLLMASTLQDVRHMRIFRTPARDTDPGLSSSGRRSLHPRGRVTDETIPLQI